MTQLFIKYRKCICERIESEEYLIRKQIMQMEMRIFHVMYLFFL